MILDGAENVASDNGVFSCIERTVIAVIVCICVVIVVLFMLIAFVYIKTHARFTRLYVVINIKM